MILCGSSPSWKAGFEVLAGMLFEQEKNETGAWPKETAKVDRYGAIRHIPCCRCAPVEPFHEQSLGKFVYRYCIELSLQLRSVPGEVR